MLTASLDGSQITLDWADNSSDETEFRIERALNGGAWLQIAVVGAGSTHYVDSDTVCGASYAYRVRAYRSSDGKISDPSSTADAATPSCSDPNLITNGSFDDNATPTPLAPDGWTGKGLSANTDGVDCINVSHGDCSFSLKGSGKAKKLVQKITTSGPEGEYSLSFDTMGTGIGSSGSYMVKLKFFLTNGDKKSYKIKVTNTGDFGWVHKTLTFTLPRSYNRVDVTIQFSKNGTAWFDNVQLVKN
jgi:hypothetical protein